MPERGRRWVVLFCCYGDAAARAVANWQLSRHSGLLWVTAVSQSRRVRGQIGRWSPWIRERSHQTGASQNISSLNPCVLMVLLCGVCVIVCTCVCCSSMSVCVFMHLVSQSFLWPPACTYTHVRIRLANLGFVCVVVCEHMCILGRAGMCVCVDTDVRSEWSRLHFAVAACRGPSHSCLC